MFLIRDQGRVGFFFAKDHKDDEPCQQTRDTGHAYPPPVGGVVRGHMGLSGLAEGGSSARGVGHIRALNTLGCGATF